MIDQKMRKRLRSMTDREKYVNIGKIVSKWINEEGKRKNKR
jgi:hypothetical protein